MALLLEFGQLSLLNTEVGHHIAVLLLKSLEVGKLLFYLEDLSLSGLTDFSLVSGFEKFRDIFETLRHSLRNTLLNLLEFLCLFSCHSILSRAQEP